MTVIDRKQLEPLKGNNNLINYQETYEQFSWESIEQRFSWHKTGLVNTMFHQYRV